MAGIPRRYSHYVFAVLQSGLTTLIAAGVASLPVVAPGAYLVHWLVAWVVSWIVMLPVVLLAAPAIRLVSHVLTVGEP